MPIHTSPDVRTIGESIHVVGLSKGPAPHHPTWGRSGLAAAGSQFCAGGEPAPVFLSLPDGAASVAVAQNIEAVAESEPGRAASLVVDLSTIGIDAAREAHAILGKPANKPPLFPTLFGMSVPLGVSTFAVAVGQRFITLSRMTS